MNKLNKITPATVFFMDFDRVRKLWDIRSQTKTVSLEEMNRSHKLLDENYKDLMEWIEKFNFF